MGMAVLYACLPDLSALPADVPEAGPPIPVNLCGNGVIDTDAESCDPGPSTNDGGSPGCVGCKVVCAGSLDLATNHCYFGVGPTQSFAEAKGKCRAEGGHLVTIGAPEELENVVDASKNYWAGEFSTVINAYESPSGLGLEPGWPEPEAGTGPCPGCFGFGLDGGGVVGEPKQCIVDQDGGWIGVPCFGQPHDTICEREPVGRRYQPCNGGLCFSAIETASKKSYLVILATVSASNARASCQAFGDQHGQLVTIESIEERNALVRELSLMAPLNESSVDFWIGLHTDNGGPWTWEGDRPGLAEPWGDKEPKAGTDAFLRVSTGYDTSLAHAGNASDLKYYVCQLPPTN